MPTGLRKRSNTPLCARARGIFEHSLLIDLPKDLPVLTKDMDTTVCVKRLFVGSRETNSKGHSSSSTETKRESCG